MREHPSSAIETRRRTARERIGPTVSAASVQAMARPLVLVVPEPLLAQRLGGDFRYPVCAEADHAAALVLQGFSVVVHAQLDGDVDADVVEVEAGLDIGAAHQRIAAAGLDPLKLNADLGTFAWTKDADDRVLLVHQAYGRHLWALPGGEIHLREAPDAAVMREVKEETGYDVQVDSLIAIYGRHQHIGLYFACTATSGEPRAGFDTEIQGVGWFDPEDPPSPISPVIGLLRADLQGGAVPARFF